MADVIKLFMDALPYSLVVPILLVVVYYLFTREKEDVIKNQVEVFFKGGTKDYYPCTVGHEDCNFNIGETEFTEPIIYNPRIEYKKGKIFRTFMFSEGAGMIEVPPLPDKDREKIFSYLKSNNVIPENLLKDKPNYNDWSTNELMEYIKFYNFDIEQITDKPILKSFTTSLNFFVSMINNLSGIVGSMEGAEYSNIAKIAIYLVGFLSGTFFGVLLQMKGVI